MNKEAGHNTVKRKKEKNERDKLLHTFSEIHSIVCNIKEASLKLNTKCLVF